MDLYSDAVKNSLELCTALQKGTDLLVHEEHEAIMNMLASDIVSIANEAFEEVYEKSRDEFRAEVIAAVDKDPLLKIYAGIRSDNNKLYAKLFYQLSGCSSPDNRAIFGGDVENGDEHAYCHEVIGMIFAKKLRAAGFPKEYCGGMNIIYDKNIVHA